MPNTGQQAYYFSDHIKIVLAKILEYPVTIVEAPSGFGKTTAIREFIKMRLSLGARKIWYTCFGEPLSVTWNVITDMIADINDELAAKLKNMEINRDLVYLPAVLRNVRCSSETYFVIDNYQLVDCDIPQLMNIISTHDNPNYILGQLKPLLIYQHSKKTHPYRVRLCFKT
jgi:LuxR family maltose regulon positive regulatory protein